MKWKIKEIDSIRYISERIEDLGLNAITEFWINMTLIMIYSLMITQMNILGLNRKGAV